MTARIIAATTRDLEQEMEEHRFREDLFYRLNVVQMHSAAAGAREGRPVFAEQFLRNFASRSGKSLSGISAEAQRKLLAYDWPGNVRQLENVLERAVALMQGQEVQPDDLPSKILQFEASTSEDTLTSSTFSRSMNSSAAKSKARPIGTKATRRGPRELWASTGGRSIESSTATIRRASVRVPRCTRTTCSLTSACASECCVIRILGSSSRSSDAICPWNSRRH